MEFNSQICTTIEQSERLLALGLKKETADMHHYQYVEGGRWNIEAHPSIAGYTNRLVPAWSLHRLMEMCPLIPNPSRFLAITSFKTVYVRMNDEMDVSYAGKGTYDNLINCIQWLIGEGYFNKEYLEE